MVTFDLLVVSFALDMVFQSAPIASSIHGSVKVASATAVWSRAASVGTGGVNVHSIRISSCWRVGVVGSVVVLGGVTHMEVAVYRLFDKAG